MYLRTGHYLLPEGGGVGRFWLCHQKHTWSPVKSYDIFMTPLNWQSVFYGFFPPPPPFPPKTTWFPPSLPQEINTDWSLGTNRNELTVPSTENILVSDAESAQPNRAQARKHLCVQKAHISLWKIARKIYKLFVFISYYALRLIPILPLL